MKRIKAQILKVSLKNQEVLVEQAMDKYNQASNSLAIVQNSLKLEETRRQQVLDELRVQMKAKMKKQMELARVEAMEAYKSSEAFANAVKEVALSRAEMGMQLYRSALRDKYPDLDLGPLDERYLESLPLEEERESSELLSPVIEIAASPDQPFENLDVLVSVPEDEVRPKQSQSKAVPPLPTEPETILPPLPKE